jgi:hypothetical protein
MNDTHVSFTLLNDNVKQLKKTHPKNGRIDTSNFLSGCAARIELVSKVWLMTFLKYSCNFLLRSSTNRVSCSKFL